MHSNNLAQWLVHRLLEEGALPEHLAFVRTEYKKRRDALVKALRRCCGEKLVFNMPEGEVFISGAGSRLRSYPAGCCTRPPKPGFLLFPARLFILRRTAIGKSAFTLLPTLKIFYLKAPAGWPRHWRA
ncbi:MAG TPA: hypothetical protein DCZ10_18805 [Pelotomaculum sp.]|nr:hypothetical protein [Pelotomaculum sp.]